MDGVFPLTIYYESQCPLCDAEMTNLRLRDSRGLLRFSDVCAPGFDDVPPGASYDDLLECIHARRADGAVVKGVEVFRLAYHAVGMSWVAALTRVPLLRGLCDRLYPVIARNRHRFPRFVVYLFFETFVRRAAERAAVRARCNSESCDSTH